MDGKADCQTARTGTFVTAPKFEIDGQHLFQRFRQLGQTVYKHGKSWFKEFSRMSSFWLKFV